MLITQAKIKIFSKTKFGHHRDIPQNFSSKIQDFVMSDHVTLTEV
jgi:hypothetical protein